MLLFKILLAPVLIALVSLAGRKWGPSISGWLLGIPLNSGPILLFVVLEQGPQFASHTAISSLLGILGWVSFTLVYAYSCLRLPWWLSMLIGWSAYLAVAAILFFVRLGVVPAFVLVAVVLAVVIKVFPVVAAPQAPTVYGRFDLWLRMATASFMVVTLTGFARILGPVASGLLSAFPGYTTILAVFNHLHEPAAAVRVMKGVAIGLYTAATFFLILSPSLLHLGVAASFALATAGCLVVQGVSLIFVRQRRS